MPNSSSVENNLICFSPINWDDAWEGPQEFMARFAEAGWSVLFVENVGGRVPRFTRHDAARSTARVKKLLFKQKLSVPAPLNLEVYTPANLPPYRWLRRTNRMLLLRGLRSRMRDLGWKRPVVWIYLPSAVVLDAAMALDPQLIVYCCIHDYAKMPNDLVHLAEEEKQTLRAADLVFVLSRQLLEERKQLNSSARLLPQGANLRDYLSATKNGRPSELEGIRTPVIGYIGTIHEWVDQDLLHFVARQRPDWTIVLIGPQKVSVRRLRELPNVVFIGPKQHQALPAYVLHFDVGIIPYLTQGFGQTIRPNKVLEYLVMGKPVVTTELPELEEFRSHITTVNSPEEFVAAVDLALATDSEEKRASRRALAEANSIDRTFGEIAAILTARLHDAPEPVAQPLG